MLAHNSVFRLGRSYAKVLLSGVSFTISIPVTIIVFIVLNLLVIMNLPFDNVPLTNLVSCRASRLIEANVL